DAQNQHEGKKVHHPGAPARSDKKGFDVAVVDAEDEDQHNIGDEQQAEEEGEAAQRLLPASLARLVVELGAGDAEKISDREHDDADHDRIDDKPDIDDIGDLRTEND